ncbi:hypothetical protein D3C81_702040 [compost metagenome]
MVRETAPPFALRKPAGTALFAWYTTLPGIRCPKFATPSRPMVTHAVFAAFRILSRPALVSAQNWYANVVVGAADPELVLASACSARFISARNAAPA